MAPRVPARRLFGSSLGVGVVWCGLTRLFVYPPAHNRQWSRVCAVRQTFGVGVVGRVCVVERRVVLFLRACAVRV